MLPSAHSKMGTGTLAERLRENVSDSTRKKTGICTSILQMDRLHVTSRYQILDFYEKFSLKSARFSRNRSKYTVQNKKWGKCLHAPLRALDNWLVRRGVPRASHVNDSGCHVAGDGRARHLRPDSGVLRDQICTASGPKVNCVRQVDF